MSFVPRMMLVTGGAGFIGSHFVRWVLEHDPGVGIVNLDKLTYAGSLDNLKGLPNADRYSFVEGDICDRDLLDRLLREEEIDTVVHFAAESHVDNSIAGPERFIYTNVQGTFSLLEATRQYWLEENHWDATRCRFHHISTDEVYGSLTLDEPPFHEKSPYAPNSPYSASKAASDHLVRAYQQTYGLPVTISNCSNNFGPCQHAEKFIPTVIRACRRQEPIPVYGDGSNIRDWLYVTDHCAAIEKVIRAGRVGEVYNIGAGNEWANIDIVRLICRFMDDERPGNAPHKRLISFVTDRPGHDWRYAIDAAKITRELDWRPVHTFETGIRKMLIC